MKKSILSLVAVAAMTVSVSATDYRAEKPAAWTAKTVPAAIEALYGKITPVEGDIKLKAPKVASNGGAIPVSVKTDIPAKSIAIFQDVNPESAVAIFEVPEGTEANFSLKIKMKKSGSITAVVEGKDGKFYETKLSLEVALGGCEG
ncbi:MAG TPA: thiosulfate oxidation carrier protein SoxY [Epsilonproteobacteria bacterium]|nr:thiosulfate oxidation carrier protein SoxY [Campylobacterota bacterium]